MIIKLFAINIPNIGEKAKVKTLSINFYHHPNMETSIDLNLDKSILLKITLCFYFNDFKLSIQPFIFDYKYTIKIMDNDINEIILQDGQFIRLLDKGYEIVTIKQ